MLFHCVIFGIFKKNATKERWIHVFVWQAADDKEAKDAALS